MKLTNILRFTIFLSATILLLGWLNGEAQTTVSTKKPASPPAKSKAEREAIEKIIREYLINNPEVLREAMQALQAKEERQQTEMTAENMKKFSAEIYADADSPILGNPRGDISVVVFYDYFCGYCKKTLPELRDLAENDKSVRIIFKEFPILSPQSLTAAQASLAAARQGKFAEFHQALLESNSGSSEALKAISDRLSLNYERLQKDMKDPKLNAAIERNIKLATLLNINGTPAYLVGNKFIPGAIDADSLAKMVASERAKLIGR